MNFFLSHGKLVGLAVYDLLSIVLKSNWGLSTSFSQWNLIYCDQWNSNAYKVAVRISKFQNMLTYSLVLLLKMRRSSHRQTHLQIRYSISDWTFLRAIISASEEVIKRDSDIILFCSSSPEKGKLCMLTSAKLIQISIDIWKNEELS